VNQQIHQAEFSQIDSGLAVPVFKQGDDPIDAINKMMSFSSTVGRQNSFAIGASGTRANISGTRWNYSCQQRDVKCFNCQGEDHMARQCPKPKRKRDATWFRDKVLLVEAQGKCKVLNEEELEFLADPEIKITSDSNIIPYSQYLLETQNAAVQIRPMLYDGGVIAKDTNVISIVDSEETLMLEEESRSKMLLKQSDPMVLDKKVNIKPINYAELNRLTEDFGPAVDLVEWNAIHDAYNEVAYLIHGSMTPELHRLFENSSPDDMIKELKSMFEKQAGVKWFDLIPTFQACKQEEDLVVGLILNGLTKDFVGFVRNYNMHNMGKMIGELHAMLIKYEKGLPKKAKTPQVMIIKGEHPAKDENCHHCKEVGYWKRNYHVYLAELLKKKKHWLCQFFREARKLKQGALYLYVGNCVREQVEEIGSFDLVLPNGLVICLENCHYAPSITRGVVSVHRLLTPPYTPQHNSVSERRNRTLLDMVRSMMNLTTLSLPFWDYALESATRILNMVPTKKVDKTPYKLWYGKVPNLSYLSVWGYEALVKQDTPDKLQKRFVKCIFIGYPKKTMGYYFYFPPENKIVVARYAEFFE
nr:retrovirus-related Pol polyprotein from transposon TNT 1-94 [Tanacetum cinerariifolium]